MNWNRLYKIRKTLSEARVDGIFISHKPNVVYFTSLFYIDVDILILQHKIYYIVLSIYKEEAEDNLPSFPNSELIELKVKDELTRILKDLVKKEKIRRLGVEANHITLEKYNILSRRLGRIIKPLSDVVEKLRLIKDKEEIELISTAVNLSKKAFFKLQQEYLKEKATEEELAWQLQYLLLKEGLELAFPPIVAVNKNTSKPHAYPSSTSLNEGDIVIVDWGGKYKGYCSDMTRTVIIGDNNKEKIKDARIKDLFQLVKEAQLLALSLIKPGVEINFLYNKIRDFFGNTPYKENFIHNLGHGVGLEIHEAPRISPHSYDNLRLEANMVFTIEPGLYIPKIGGVRYEDVVVMTEDGYKLL
jgi:Xaa-Pro aminopeptidase